jgi:GGDEF domain-containing protein
MHFDMARREEYLFHSSPLYQASPTRHMSTEPTLVYYSAEGGPPPPVVASFAADQGLAVLLESAPGQLVTRVYQRLPIGVVLAAGDVGAMQLCRELKADAFTAVVPVIFLAGGVESGVVHLALQAGADEILTDGMSETEQVERIRRALRRAERDVGVNPTTRLPGTAQIERDIAERIQRLELFAVCYADLDHFKEFNDRYGYNDGDRVIKLLSRILREVVRAHAPGGFVGHIGGDDFIFNVPLEHMAICCEDVLEIFDELIPYQYTENDRRAGYFLGKDRRGAIHRIPLMTLSIGVVTNQHRNFSHTARVSELATEMKSYAKTLTGSVYAVDRRSDAPPPGEPSEASGTARTPVEAPYSP